MAFKTNHSFMSIIHLDFIFVYFGLLGTKRSTVPVKSLEVFVMKVVFLFKACRTLEERAEQTASRGDQLCCFITCAVEFS